MAVIAGEGLEEGVEEGGWWLPRPVCRPVWVSQGGGAGLGAPQALIKGLLCAILQKQASLLNLLDPHTLPQGYPLLLFTYTHTHLRQNFDTRVS